MKIEKLEDLTEEEKNWLYDYVSTKCNLPPEVSKDTILKLIEKEYGNMFLIDRLSDGINVLDIYQHRDSNVIEMEYKSTKKKET